MLFLGRHKVYVYLGKKVLGVIRRSNSICCPFRFLMLILARRTFRLFNRFSIVHYTTITNFVFLSLLSLQNHLLTVCKIVVVVPFFLSVFCMI